MAILMRRVGGNPSHVGALFAFTSMCSAQLGLAASVPLIERVGAFGAAWLRLASAGVMLLLWVRPWRLRYSRAALRSGVLLGVATAAMGLSFMAAAARLPLGTASALEFLGPLAIALWHGRRLHWGWPLLAALGVLGLTQPWGGAVDGVGVLYALAGAGCYAGYILATRHLGAHSEGLAGLGISLPVAALVSTAVAAPWQFTGLDVALLAKGALLAWLMPMIPFALELVALRRLRAENFALLMCLEPAIAAVMGVLWLGQRPGVLALAGLACVVVAGVGAVWRGERQAPPQDELGATG